MNKGVIAFIVVFVVLLVIAYVYTNGFKSITKSSSVTSTLQATTTITANGSTSTIPTTVNYSESVTPCSSFQLLGQQLNTSYTARCISNGSRTYGVWLAAGNSGTAAVTVVGADKKTYINQTAGYNCTTFLQNFSGPSQIYTITLDTGKGGGSCGNPQVIVNTTTTPPQILYNYIINGNFGSGTYAGWNSTGAGFGTAPLNLTAANSNMCYQGTPWAGYNGTHVATTYTCGISVAPGNLTSLSFIVNPGKPFLNFKIISPEDNLLYIALLSQNSSNGAASSAYNTVVIAHFNTYNISISPNSASTFVNVSIPLTSYIEKAMRIRIVAGTINSRNYIAVGDFVLANSPNQQKGVGVNITTTN